MAPTHVLDYCETRISNYMLEVAAATDYRKAGELLENADLEREGFFRIADTNLLLTDLTRGCWDTYWRVGKSVNNLIAENVLDEA